MSFSSIKYLFTCLFLTCFLSTCEKPYYQQIDYFWNGVQEENGFMMHVVFFNDKSAPVRVLSGGGHDYDTDEEYLTVSYTEDGFSLCDPKTKQILYTAIYVDSIGYSENIYIRWTHSPGTAWKTYAETNGWKREMRLSKVFPEAE